VTVYFNRFQNPTDTTKLVITQDKDWSSVREASRTVFFILYSPDVPPSRMIRTNRLKIFWHPGIFMKKMVRLSTMSHLWIILTFIIFEEVVFLQPKKEFSEGSTSFCAFPFKCLTPSPQWRVLVPDDSEEQSVMKQTLKQNALSSMSTSRYPDEPDATVSPATSFFQNILRAAVRKAATLVTVTGVVQTGLYMIIHYNHLNSVSAFNADDANPITGTTFEKIAEQQVSVCL
jgi:hypothetical protein